MGMIHDDGDTLNVARIFQERVKSGGVVQVGTDEHGLPLYMDAQTASGRRRFAWLDQVSSSILNAFVRKGGVK
jgi:hypothetical protein